MKTITHRDPFRIGDSAPEEQAAKYPELVDRLPEKIDKIISQSPDLLALAELEDKDGMYVARALTYGRGIVEILRADAEHIGDGLSPEVAVKWTVNHSASAAVGMRAAMDIVAESISDDSQTYQSNTQAGNNMYGDNQWRSHLSLLTSLNTAA